LFEPNLRVLWGVNPKKWGLPPPQRTNKFWFKQMSLIQVLSLGVSTFYVQQFKKFYFGRAIWGGEQGFATSPEEPQISSPGRLLNLVQTLVSQTTSITSYIVSFNFLCSAVQKFPFGRAILGRWGFAPQRTSKFGRNNFLTINFLHYEFQLSMLSSSKISL